MTGGGTAGHVNPALSIAQIIAKKAPDSVIEFIGTADRLEARLVPKAGYKLHTIEVYGLRRSLSPKNIKTLYKAYESYRKCKKILKELSPDAVIGTGGYVSWPVCRAAVSLGIPTILHEANAQPGFAVKMLDSKADAIFVNFEDTVQYLKSKKTEKIHAGMPIDEMFYSLDKQEARAKVMPKGHKYMVLSFGGSLGAEKINASVLDMMSSYGKNHPEVYFLHATGSRAYEGFMAEFKSRGLDSCSNLKVSEYIYDMPHQMAAADIVVCRSGASTMSELAALGKPSVLVPSPNVTNDQQYKNAKVFADKGGACLIKDDAFTGALLEQTLAQMLESPEKLNEMSRVASTFAVRDTSERIFEKVIELIK